MMLSVVSALILALLVSAGAWVLRATVPSAEQIATSYATPLPAPEGPLRVFHLGHSLVGRDMPAMLAQLAGHEYESQLGWGTSLREHWEPDAAINGFEAENDHPRFRDAREAVGSGDYGAVVLTEMVEIKDAVKYHESTIYFGKWADRARAATPQPRIYLYESWHRLDVKPGWMARLDGDLETYWQGALLYPDLGKNPRAPAYLIPVGQVMAHFVRSVETMGGLGPVKSREDLFQRKEDGSVDQIHVNDLGAYLVALTHYAVLYHRSPVGLPHALMRADGSAAIDPGADLARLMQQSVWEVVTALPQTGIGS
ncbi:hypothetical protein [Roseovarius carneus]|uniref:hypothetical protein n=1 Tax=Roseovarius carneus TaxID=2853164 RepID=UPI001CCA78F3|nr:hypothetical protein [Roseovarius carneus]